MMMIASLVVIAVLAWVLRFVGQKVTNNAPTFRDMPYGVAFGYVLGAALLVWLAWAYIQSRSADPMVANRFFFLKAAVEGFVIFGAAAFVFKLIGKAVGTEGSKKLFRTMPLTASFGLLVIILARAVGQNIVVMDYIEAAKLRGEGMGYLVFKEILPNATAPLLAEFGLRFCFVFLTIAVDAAQILGAERMSDLLVKIRGLKLEGRSDETWNPIINGVDLDLRKGEVLGLIGESGAGKSTLGLAAMGFCRDGVRCASLVAPWNSTGLTFLAPLLL